MTMVQAVDWGNRTQSNTIPVSYWSGSFGPVTTAQNETITTQPLTQAEANAFTKALQLYQTFLNIQWDYQGDNVNTRMNLMVYSTSDANNFGSMGPPGAPAQGIGAFNRIGTGWDENGGGGLNAGGQGFETLLHELGHSLGLKHPHDDGPGGRPIFEGVTSPFNDYGDFNQNQGVYTMMSYNQGWATGPASARPDAAGLYGRVGTPMAFDIAVLQAKYGANTTFANGNNTYVLPDKNAVGTYWACIWDTGGNDSIVYNGIKTAVINLSAATLAHNASGGGWLSSAAGVAGGFTIAHNVWIENAVGGNGIDVITGNAHDNGLNGRNGNDALYGVGGNDTLFGANGNDLLAGGAGIDKLTGGANSDYFVFNAPLSYANRDVITDFNHVADTFRLENAVMTKLGAGVHALNPAFFWNGPTAHDANDYIVYNRASGVLAYDFNGSLSGGATVLALLLNKPLLAANDFVVF